MTEHQGVVAAPPIQQQTRRRHARPRDNSRLRNGMALGVLAGTVIGVTGVTASSAFASTSGGTHYWYLKHGHWYWTSHYGKYLAYVNSGGVGNGTAGPDFAASSRSAPARSGVTSTRSTGAHYWYLKHGHWYWTSHYGKYLAYVNSGGVGNGTAGPDFAVSSHASGATARSSASPKARGPAGVHYWYLKHDHWYWTSHYDKYLAYVNAGGVGNGTAGPDFAVSSGPTPSVGSTAATPRAGSATTASQVSGSTAERAVAFARAQLGKPYVWGGNGPNSYDCSGLVQQSYLHAGVHLPRVANDQAAATRRVSRSQLRPGDLLFWSSNGTIAGVHHDAIYIGGNQYIEAAHPGTNVRISTITSGYLPSFYGRP